MTRFVTETFYSKTPDSKIFSNGKKALQDQTRLSLEGYITA